MIYMIFLITMIFWIASFLAMTQKAESLTSLAWGIALRNETIIMNHINQKNHSSDKKININENSQFKNTKHINSEKRSF